MKNTLGPRRRPVRRAPCSAGMAELVDAGDSKSPAARRGGSIPSTRTTASPPMREAPAIAGLRPARAARPDAVRRHPEPGRDSGHPDVGRGRPLFHRRGGVSRPRQQGAAVSEHRNIAVLGAGIAGAAAARRLADAGMDVRVFDKGRGVGGRMATRQSTGCSSITARSSCARTVPPSRRSSTIGRDGASWRPGPGAGRWVGVPGMTAPVRDLLTDLAVASDHDDHADPPAGATTGIVETGVGRGPRPLRRGGDHLPRSAGRGPARRHPASRCPGRTGDLRALLVADARGWTSRMRRS